MHINKKLISYLLGGGVAIATALFGVNKLSNKITKDKQIENLEENANPKNKRYIVLNSQFKTKSPAKFRPSHLYLPQWEDDAAWKTVFDDKDENPEWKDLKKPSDFKDYCYKKIESNSYDECNKNETFSWCIVCQGKVKS